MTTQEIRHDLSGLAEPAYADFQAKLTPNVPRDLFLGVRVPLLRKFAAELRRSGGAFPFLNELPHTYYDENMLHALLLSGIRDFDTCLEAVEAFLPHVDNWAVCDSLSPRCFRSHREQLLPSILRWIDSGEEFTVRFGLDMLMSHFLDDCYRPEILSIAASVRSEKYYVKMMNAWFFATALTKQWDDAVAILRSGALDPWVRTKAIQKARESRCLSEERKQYLKSLRSSSVPMEIRRSQ